DLGLREVSGESRVSTGTGLRGVFVHGGLRELPLRVEDHLGVGDDGRPRRDVFFRHRKSGSEVRGVLRHGRIDTEEVSSVDPYVTGGVSTWDVTTDPRRPDGSRATATSMNFWVSSRARWFPTTRTGSSRGCAGMATASFCCVPSAGRRMPHSGRSAASVRANSWT